MESDDINEDCLNEVLLTRLVLIAYLNTNTLPAMAICFLDVYWFHNPDTKSHGTAAKFFTFRKMSIIDLNSCLAAAVNLINKLTYNRLEACLSKWFSSKEVNWLVGFNAVSTFLELFYTKKLGSHVHCMFIFTFFCVVVFKEFFSYIVLSNTNNFLTNIFDL